MTTDHENIPRALRSLAQWVVWRLRPKDGRPTKVPYQALLPSSEASSTDPATWATFEEACDAASDPANRLDGIGFVFSKDDPFAGVDLDNCLDEDLDLQPWARAVLDRLGGYAETSPSGRGVKVFVRGECPGGKGRKRGKLGPDGRGAIECYDRGRYFTVTGRARGTLDVADDPEGFAAFHAETFPPPAAAAPRPRPAPLGLDDQELLRRMFAARNGAAIEALYGGDSGRHASGSEADLALCSHLAFYTGGDVDAIDRIFRGSALCDEKWLERPDYRERTIQKALDGCNFYDPSYRNGTPNGNGNGLANGNGYRPPGANGDGHGNGNGNGHPPVPVPAPRPPGPAGPSEGHEDPHRLTRVILDSRFKGPEGIATLVFWNEEWHRWDGLAWRPVPDKEVAATFTRGVKAEFDRIAVEDGKMARPVTTKAVGNVLQAARDVALLALADCPRQPAWIGPREPGDDWPDPAEVLPASNALVHLPEYVAGGRWRVAPTPRFFSPYSLGYGFEADAPDPAEWLRFLGSLWPDDPESVEAIQEWFGYCLTPDTSQQKIAMLIGPKRCGKGTIARILRAVIGADNVAAPTLAQLDRPFGLAPLIGKPLAIIGDARLSARTDQAVIVERLLSISGEDAQTIDRKHRSSWTGTLPTRFLILSNELPRLADSSGALPSRMVLLRLSRSFYGREDVGLFPRLLTERAAILRWSIAGWDRLRSRGYFRQPESGRQMLDDLEEMASPVKVFVEERCALHPDASVAVKSIYAAWREWCKEKGREHPGDEALLGRNLRAAFPQLATKQRRLDGAVAREFHGIELSIVPPGPAF